MTAEERARELKRCKAYAARAIKDALRERDGQWRAALKTLEEGGDMCRAVCWTQDQCPSGAPLRALLSEEEG